MIYEKAALACGYFNLNTALSTTLQVGKILAPTTPTIVDLSFSAH
jgi:hypothetical protein